MESMAINGLTKRYGDTVTLGPVSFTISKGEIVSIIGGNGAGKTTLLELLCGLRKPTSGTISFNGGERPATAFLPQKLELYPELKVRELVRHFSTLNGSDGMGRLVDMFALKGYLDRRYGTLSGGLKQRVNVCCVMCQEPELVLMDEPATGLDPKIREETWSLIRTMRDRGVTVVLSTHFVEEARRNSDRILLMRNGHLLYDGEPYGLDLCSTFVRVACPVPEGMTARDGAVVRNDSVVFSVDGTEELVSLITELTSKGVPAGKISLNMVEDLEGYR